MEEIRTAGVLVFDGDSVLLVRHGDGASHLTGKFGVPAGRIDEGEELVDAAIREFNEETGLMTGSEYLSKIPETFRAEIERKDGTIKKFSMDVFVCKKFWGEIKKSDEAIPEWVDFSGLEKLNLLPNTIEAVKFGKDLAKLY